MDLLGFKDQITKEWDNLDPKKDPLNRLLAIKCFLELSAKKAVTHKFQDYDGKIIVQVPYPKIITFSDSFIFILPVRKKDPTYRLACVLAITGSIIELWRKSVEEGFTIRGAVDFGEIYHNDTDLIGPALIETYTQESKVAITSRIIYTSSVLNTISTSLPKGHIVLKDYFKRYFVSDVDKLLILNPLIVFGGYKDPILLKRTIRKFKQMSSSLKNPMQKAKYTNLIARLRSRRSKMNDYEKFNLYWSGRAVCNIARPRHASFVSTARCAQRYA